MASEGDDLYHVLGKSVLEGLANYEEVVLEDVEIEVDELIIWLQQAVPSVVKELLKAGPPKPAELVRAKFTPPKTEWIGKIVEVKLGATRADGGTRDRSLVIGGETLPPFYIFEGKMPHPPVVAMDVFDMRIPLPKAIKSHFEDVMDDPAEWARRCVKKYNAEMINLHLVSTDPYLEDTPPSKAAKTVEETLQAVKVPICVGGSGNPQKDPEVFAKVAEVAEGERLLINSVNLDMDLEKATNPIKKYGHAVIAFTPMDLDLARELNRKLYEYLPKDAIVMDTNCSGIGYGFEYGFTVMERARLAALKGDEELQHPLAAGVTNAWAAREAWTSLDPFWGPKEIRGPIWETITAVSMLLVGADYFMMMHPLSINTLKSIVRYLLTDARPRAEEISTWASAKLR